MEETVNVSENSSPVAAANLIDSDEKARPTGTTKQAKRKHLLSGKDRQDYLDKHAALVIEQQGDKASVSAFREHLNKFDNTVNPPVSDDELSQVLQVVSAQLAKASQKGPAWRKLEREAAQESVKLLKYLGKRNVRYLRDETGEFQVLLDGKRIALNYDKDNYDLDQLLLDACDLTMHSRPTHSVISRLIKEARTKAGKFRVRYFSAMSEDRKRLYVPVVGENSGDTTRELLEITPEHIRRVPNGENADGLWLEHPLHNPLSYTAPKSPQGLRTDLEAFENLIVRGQILKVPEMAYLIAMQESAFPYVRDAVQNRLITEHSGGTGEGKTAGARCSIRLNVNSKDVIGRGTAATLYNAGDPGLLVLDNKEGEDFHTQEVVNYFLFAATGSDNRASNPDGTAR